MFKHVRLSRDRVEQFLEEVIGMMIEYRDCYEHNEGDAIHAAVQEMLEAMDETAEMVALGEIQVTGEVYDAPAQEVT